VALFGETGVGKSTLINGISNYCSFESLEDAVKADGFFPIPSTFTTTDPQTKKQIIISSESQIPASTHIKKVGESVTEYPNEYAFLHTDTNTVINFIDTPGLLDTSDVGTSTHDTDKQHVDNILKLLSAYEEIHAILILMKANVSRLSDALQYTLTEIFKRLDKSACNNVIFIFTNAASTQFKTEKTQPLLHRFLKEKKLSIPLPPEKPTIHCFENYTVQYLAECKNKIPHDEDDVQDVQRHWKRSVKSTKEMLSYISSLEPHSLAVIKSIYDATSMVSTTSKLLLDTMMCIFKDVNEMEEQQNEAERMKDEVKRNSTDFVIEKFNNLWQSKKTLLVSIPLDHIRVVCESSRCAKVGEGHTIYPRICHVHKCNDMASKINAVLSDIQCRRMWEETCKICGCNSHEHRFRYTETKVILLSVYQPDRSVIDKIVNSDDALKVINEGISQLYNRVKQCKDEAQQMMEICAKLNAFAQQNALFTADDELMKCLENARQTYAKLADTSINAKDLSEINSQYEQHFRRAMNSNYCVEHVPKLVEQLYKLPMRGQDIKDVVDTEEKVRLRLIEEAKKSKQNFIIKGTGSAISFVSEK